MKILCIICHDLLIPTEDIFFTHCGHVFHHRCLSQWFERSKTCPQCRARTAEDRIHKAHFTVSNTEDNEDNLQGRIDSLKFQVLLNERNIKHYISKNAVLEKQNAGLRLEVRKVESEIRQKNSNIYALKDEIRYFKEKHQEYEVLKKELSEKKREVKQFRDIYKTLSTSTLDDMQDIIRETTDRNTLMNYIFVMKKIMSKKTRTINYLQGQLLRHRGSLEEERSKKVDFEQINTKQESADQSDSSSSEAEVEIISDSSQEMYSRHKSTLDECPTVTKKAKLCLRSGNSSDKTNDMITNDIRSTAGISSQSKQEKC
ncbi:PREDICTED: E3 ubiquitin-protein ligase TRAIP-like isoform X2 [Wasmannia auropunctata]|uniref:E3 ubiquitin-protein ligase TRAIP-like isoform X2 n=1 Tax=Wasmannia auropunctata TaxID=64793 RepID=UPI0005F0ACD6|nr:PREDICTED: E3 ubiquitin-protein ligase TRAIP-like isoform X2 [Wasmannia auropunctata]